MTLTVTFHPGNLGNFNDVLNLKYINGMYELPLRVMGSCRNIAPKAVLKLNKKKIG